MAICTFFGHRDRPPTVQPMLQQVLEELIVHHYVNVFYVSHQGRFDTLVRRTLTALQTTYPHIRVTVVLAYIPDKETADNNYEDTLLSVRHF